MTERKKMPETISARPPRETTEPRATCVLSERDYLIERYLGYTRALAQEVLQELNSPPRLELDDLVGYGELGLVEAAARFDPCRGVAFTTFAYYRIRGAIYDGLRRMGWLSRNEYRRSRFAAAANRLRQMAADDEQRTSPINNDGADLDHEIVATRQAVGALIPVYLLSLESTEDMPELIDPGALHSTTFEREDLKRATRAMLAELTEEDRLIIEEIYYRNSNMVEVAAKIGASKSWVSRLHARAIGRLRAALERHGLLEAT